GRVVGPSRQVCPARRRPPRLGCATAAARAARPVFPRSHGGRRSVHRRRVRPGGDRRAARRPPRPDRGGRHGHPCLAGRRALARHRQPRPRCLEPSDPRGAVDPRHGVPRGGGDRRHRRRDRARRRLLRRPDRRRPDARRRRPPRLPKPGPRPGDRGDARPKPAQRDAGHGRRLVGRLRPRDPRADDEHAPARVRDLGPLRRGPGAAHHPPPRPAERDPLGHRAGDAGTGRADARHLRPQLPRPRRPAPDPGVGDDAQRRPALLPARAAADALPRSGDHAGRARLQPARRRPARRARPAPAAV
ncbi:MAG: Dipeptide transport system permease protein DppC, partial [uncultured Thermomicrobiales bacterium]